MWWWWPVVVKSVSLTTTLSDPKLSPRTSPLNTDYD